MAITLRTSTTFRRRGTGLALSLAAVLALSACGTAASGDDPEPATDDAPAADSAADEADAEPIDYPTRNVSLIVPFAAGGGTDLTVRPFVQAFEGPLGGRVVVENRPGGGGVVGVSDVLRASPDGHMIATPIDSILTVQPRINPDVDFAHDTFPSLQFAAAPLVVVTNADAPWEDLPSFLEEARQRPGELTYGNPGLVTGNDLNGRALEQAADVDLESVPFAGGGADVLTALLRGDIDVAVMAWSAMRGQVEAGELRPLAVLDEERLAAVPDLPSLPDLGLESPFFHAVGITLSFPPETPEAIIDHVADAAQTALEDPDLLATWSEVGITPRFLDSGDTADYLASLSDAMAELFDLYPDLTNGG